LPVGRDFPHPSRPALGSPQPPIQWVPGPGWTLPLPLPELLLRSLWQFFSVDLVCELCVRVICNASVNRVTPSRQTTAWFTYLLVTDNNIYGKNNVDCLRR